MDSALIKVLENKASDLNAFISAFPTQILLRVRQVKDANGNVLYLGYAPVDAALTDAKWLIKKFIYDAGQFNTDIIFANGEAKFTHVMTDPTIYTYSET
jgi:hypothetical protein